MIIYCKRLKLTKTLFTLHFNNLKLNLNRNIILVNIEDGIVKQLNLYFNKIKLSLKYTFCNVEYSKL